jgi:ABC-type glycerol-3-phosphate transport system permease component
VHLEQLIHRDSSLTYFLNTIISVSVTIATMAFIFVTWLMASFVRDVPWEILESACVEGSTRMGTFYKVIFPMLTPAIASATILIMQEQ